MGPALAGTWNGNAERAVAAAGNLVDDNAALLAVVDARYRGVTERIAHDGAFLGYLARQAQLADQP